MPQSEAKLCLFNVLWGIYRQNGGGEGNTGSDGVGTTCQFPALSGFSINHLRPRMAGDRAGVVTGGTKGVFSLVSTLRPTASSVAVW